MRAGKTRCKAVYDDSIVVFLSGFKLNKRWQFWKWIKVTQSVKRILSELEGDSGHGFLGYERWHGNPDIVVQYWRSYDELIRYARSKDARHFPAWVEFNESIADDASYGLWHEIYIVPAGKLHGLYRNMPPIGLGKINGCDR